MNRLAIEIIVGLVASVAVFFYIEHLGAAKCERQGAAAVATQEQHNGQVEAAGTIAGIMTENTYAHALEQPLAPLPSLEGGLPDLRGMPADDGVHAPGKCPVSAARSHSVAGDYRPTIRNEATASLVPAGWGAFEQSDVSDARDADAEVIYLQSLLQTQYRVCTGQISPARP